MADTAEVSQKWVIAEQAFSEIDRIASQKTAAFLGSVALAGEVQFTRPEEVNTSTLMSATQMAALGDEQSRKTVRANVSADVAERLYKAAHQTKIAMNMSHGKLHQNGRRLTDIHRNTLENTVLNREMLRRAKLELKNALLFEELHAAGVLELYDAVVFSPSPTAMSLQEKKDYHFFLDTETCSIQRLSASGNQVTMESAFVAGKRSPSSSRHDIAAINLLVRKLGVPINSEDGTDVLQYVLLVPKSQIPNGVVDVVMLYDEASGGTFYGESKPQQDYLTYAQECQNRAAQFEEMVQAITVQLIKEAHAFTSPLEAILRLDELSARFCVKYAVKDESINVAIFGAEAARHIEDARFFAERGETARAESSLIKAQNTDDSGSCPLFKGQSEADNAPDSTGSKESSHKKWMKCPHCSARVFDDPCAKVLSCWDCKALVVNGQVWSKGNGGSKARAEKRSESKKHEAKLVKQVDDTFRETSIESFESENRKTNLQQVRSLGQSALTA